ncbi:hypothetical protein GIS00_24655 [Nakamurella sp. YIM 132087]|uniref:Secreted protein n=1 Tax=Nakamurella alba TaxID=2665158 RepID=A0A7K1FSP2_9ACTN|nr:hypothetical protein [Nakamurella alba]MTD17131.1 hypothetical protein [Nakamurella alba]
MRKWIHLVTAAAAVAAITAASVGSVSAAVPRPSAVPAPASSAPVVNAAPPLVTVQESVYVAIIPCRIVDTRLIGGPFASRQVRSYNVSGSVGFPAQGGRNGGCGIPSTATAIAASMTAVGPTGTGYLRAWPANKNEPNATLVNYTKGINTENGAIVPIQAGAAPGIKAKNYAGPTGLVIDVTGYFAPQIAVSLDATGGILGGGLGINDVVHTTGSGTYLLETDVDISNCIPTVISTSPLVGGLLGGSQAQALIVDANHIQVQVGTLDLAGILTLGDAPITLSLNC